ncbi:MAG: quinone-dependent dihydroorotate dehydrogenase [Saprospiraceae bacterium]|nr:quinone-dependent dihydroorotate dehydrogenase [Saprospiraceae bacterium]
MWRFVFRPLLFLMSPEKAHYFTLNALKWVCTIPGFKNILKWWFSSRIPELPIHLFGLEFKNRVGLAAGLDKDGKYIVELALLGFSHIEIGTVTPMPQAGNPAPRLFRLPMDNALINRMGFNNEGAESMVNRLKHLDKPKDLILGINIGKNKATPLEQAEDDYLKCFDMLFPFADYFTINISSPNTPGLRGLQAREPLTRLLTAITVENQNKPNPKPILVKLAPDLSLEELTETRQILNDFKVDGIIMGNTTIDRAGLTTPNALLNKIGMGGLSGKPLQIKATKVLNDLKSIEKNIPLIGVGGIMNAADAKRKIEAGASLIQVYTGFVYNGPALIRSIVNALNKQP